MNRENNKTYSMNFFLSVLYVYLGTSNASITVKMLSLKPAVFHISTGV